MFNIFKNLNTIFRKLSAIFVFSLILFFLNSTQIYAQTDNTGPKTNYGKVQLDCSDKADLFGWSQQEYINCLTNFWNKMLLEAYSDEKMFNEEDIASLSAHIPVFAQDIKRQNDNAKINNDETKKITLNPNPFYHDVSIAAYIIVTTNPFSKARIKCSNDGKYTECMDNEFSNELSRLRNAVVNFDLSSFKYDRWDSVSVFLKSTFEIPEMTEPRYIYYEKKREALKLGLEDRLPMDCVSIVEQINSIEDLARISEKWKRDVIRKYAEITYQTNPDTLFYSNGLHYADDPVDEFLSRRDWVEVVALNNHFSKADNGFIKALKYCREAADCGNCLKKQLELQGLILSARSQMVLEETDNFVYILDVLVEKITDLSKIDIPGNGSSKLLDYYMELSKDLFEHAGLNIETTVKKDK